MACYGPISVGVPRDSIRPGGPKIWSEVTVPCGFCLGCRAKQARDWAFRILHETRVHDSAWFVTLTYSNENIPAYGSLYPEHLRILFKTLRRDGHKISYFACGEYGETTQRPHYHAVLYGLDLLDKHLLRDSPRTPVWRSPFLESYWTHGLSEFSSVTPGSASYVAGYVRKKVRKKTFPEHYTRVDPDTGELVDLEPEFSRMSLKPAIGKRWIEKYWEDVYPRDFVVMNGKEYKPPRYYDKWMEKNHPEIMFEVKMKRDSEAEYIPPEKLQAKEKIHRARSNLYEKRNTV